MSGYGTAPSGAKRPFIRNTAFGPIPRQMVFKQTFEEDIVDSTGVVKGGSAPPLLPRPAHPDFDLASRQPEIAEHAVVELGEFGYRPAGSQRDKPLAGAVRHCQKSRPYAREAGTALLACL
jgi:hypothetical protein